MKNRFILHMKWLLLIFVTVFSSLSSANLAEDLRAKCGYAESQEEYDNCASSFRGTTDYLNRTLCENGDPACQKNAGQESDPPNAVLVPVGVPSGQPSQKPAQAKASDPKDPVAAKDPSSAKAPTNEAGTEKLSAESQANLLQELKNQAAEDLRKCTQDYEKAATCCMNPMKCAGGSSMVTDGLNIATALGTTVGGAMMMQTGGNPAQMKGICEALKYGSMGTAAANVGLAGICSEKHNTCENTCEAVAAQWEGKVQQYSAYPAVKGEAQRTLAKMRDQKAQCGALASYATKMVAQGVSTGTAAALFQQCQNLTTQSTGFENINTNRAVNCADPAYQNTAQCANCALYPNNPYCQMPNLAGSPSTVGTISTRSVGNGSDASKFNVDSLGDGTKQTGLGAAGGSGEASKALAMQSNAGGQMLGGQANPNAGDQGGRNPGASGKPSADILQGERSGGGYSTFSSADGGFSGYGSHGGGGGSGMASALKGFDLKKYLPGQEKDPAARKLAAVGDPTKMINGKHECDLFACVSRRVTLICAQDRLMDCGTVVAPAKAGGPL